MDREARAANVARAGHTGAHRNQVRDRLHTFYAWCADANIEELHTLATTVKTWWPAIEAFIHTGITNARTEGINRLVKQLNRSACGFRNTVNSHRRIRVHCTRTARAAAATSRSLPLKVEEPDWMCSALDQSSAAGLYAAALKSAATQRLLTTSTHSV